MFLEQTNVESSYREKERERQRETDRQTERQREVKVRATLLKMVYN